MERQPGSVVEPLTDDEQAFLRAFSRALVTVPRAFDADLVREQGMSASDYFTLMYLSEAPERSLRMSDLAGAAALSLSGMTRIVQRLESQGLVRRDKSDCDRRSWIAVLTDAGLERLASAWPTHLASVRRHVFQHLSGIDLRALTAALQSFAVTAPEACGTGNGALVCHDGRAGDDPLVLDAPLTDRTTAPVVEMWLSEEEVEVTTRVVPRERVRVFVDTLTEEVVVDGTVAREVVEVDGLTS